MRNVTATILFIAGLALMIYTPMSTAAVDAIDLPTIRAALMSDDVQTRRDAAASLIGSSRESLINMLDTIGDHLADSDGEVRYLLAEALIDLEHKAAPVVSQLISLIDDPQPMVRIAAIEALAGLNTKAAPAAKKLAKRVKYDPNEMVRGWAAAALVSIGESAQPTIDALLQDRQDRVRLTMVTALRGKPHLDENLQAKLLAASPEPIQYAEEITRLYNGDFEADSNALTGWTVQYVDGAEGDWALDSSTVRNGKQSLKITKTNGRGYILLRSTKPVELTNSSTPTTCRFWFHAEDAPSTSLLLLRLEDAETGELRAGGMRTSFTWQSQSFLRNSVPGKWEKRVLMLKPGTQAGQYYVNIAMYGNPGSVWIDDITLPAADRKFTISDPTPSQPIYSEAEAERIISGRPDMTAKVEHHDGRVELLLNGKPTSPVLHMPLNPTMGDYAVLKEEANIHLQTVYIKLNDFNGRYEDNENRVGAGPMWPSAKHDRYDFTEAMRAVKAAARRSPHSNLLIGFHITWPRDYVEVHPDTTWANARGEKAYGNWLYFKGFTKSLPQGDNYWPSPYLDQPFEDAGDVIAAFFEHLKQTPYSKMVVGCFVSGGHDGQFYIRDRDYSAAATQAWRDWLRDKYQTDVALSQAWHDKSVTLATAPVPPSRQAYQVRGRKSEMFFDPSTERSQRDYHEFRTWRMWRIKEILAATAKQAAGKNIIALTWHMGGGMTGNFEPLFNSTALDGCIAQPGYQYRFPGYINGFSWITDSFAKAGKLIIKEMDTRSWIRETYRGDEIASMKISTPMTPEHFRSLMRKEVGQMIANDQGWWYYDISNTAFRHPEMVEEISHAKRVADEVRSSPRRFESDAVVVYSTNSYLWGRTTHYGFRNLPAWMLGYQEWMLRTSGLTFDRVFLADLMAEQNPDRYKLYIIANCYHLNDEERRFINERLKRQGKTLIWLYAPGYLSDTEVSTAQISEMVEMNVSTDFSTRSMEAVADEQASAIAPLMPLQGVGGVFQTQFGWEPSARDTYNTQRFVIDDPDARPIARYADDGSLAIAMKKHSDWTSVYVANLAGLSAELLHAIARQAGCHTVLNPNQAVLEMNGRFLSLHALRTGTLEIKLPQSASVTDAITGKEITSSEQFNVAADAQKSYWFKLNSSK